MRFYSIVMDFKTLNDMKEDLIELITSTTINDELS